MAFGFNGTSQYLHASPAVATATPIVMSCWFWADAITGHMILVSLAAANPSSHRFAMFIHNPSGTLRAQVSGGSFPEAVSSISVTTGAWHHGLCLFKNSTSRTVWLDGGNSGINTTSQTPSSLVDTVLGTSRVVSPTSLHDGRLAEVAIWAGSGVENMGSAEAGQLAAGLSPLCLNGRLKNLVCYQPLIRDLNWPGIGPEMTAVGGPPVIEHPQAIYPANPAIGLWQIPPFFPPYRLSAAAAHANRVHQGLAAVAGTSVGDTFSIGEVST